MQIHLDTLVRRTDDVLTTELDGALVALHIQSGYYYGLDDIGARIWKLLDKPVTVQDIVGILLAEYDVTRDICEQDVLAFLQQIAAQKLLEKC